MIYPPVIIVHLSRHKERRRRLSAILKRHDFTQVTWLDAIDGRKLKPSPPWQASGLPPVTAWQNWADPYARRAMTLGEVGCALSHVIAWQNIADSGYPAIVLEDDAVAVESLIQDLPLLINDLDYLNFELCYLAQRNAPGPKPLMGRHVHVVDYHPVWTLAYLLTPAGAEKLLASPWQTHLIPSDELLPGVFGKNRNPEVNDIFATSSGLVVSSNQRFFTPADGSEKSETEKSQPVREAKPVLSAFTVATERLPELQRLLNSGLRYGLQIEPLGLGTAWRGGDMFNGPGGGQKINLLRPALQQLPPEQPTLFVDGYDTIICGHAADIVAAWNRTCNGPLFAAEVYCWPDKHRIDDYPQIDTPYRFLNSGAFIGKAGDLLGIVEDSIDDHADDQLYYTERFLSGKYNIALDSNCQLFQCLNGALDDVQSDEGRGMLFNRRTETWPAVIHANGPSKSWLEKDGSAVGGRWRKYYGKMP